MTIAAHRYHDWSAGHRVVGHENKCKLLHGHNYRTTFYCQAPELDHLGRVVDFSVMKSTLCQWLEDSWDHKFIMWENDPVREVFLNLPDDFGVVYVPFNPTAENLAKHLLYEVGPKLLQNTSVTLISVEMMETRKCGATVFL